MQQKRIEMIVGLFMLAGIAALLMLSLKVSGLSNFTYGASDYSVTASFDNIGSLKPRAPVTISGVKVGEVTKIIINKTTFKAVATLQINADQNALPSDTTASILTEGLLGSNYISLNPGFNDDYLKNGSVIQDTHSALVLENLIGQLLFQLKGDSKKESKK